jgi:hypothetical protein
MVSTRDLNIISSIVDAFCIITIFQRFRVELHDNLNDYDDVENVITSVIDHQLVQ